MLLDEVHRLQRQEIGFETDIEVGIRDEKREAERSGESDGGDENMTNDRGGTGDGHIVNGKPTCNGERHGVFLVEDTRSKLPCNRRNTPSHYREHAKVVTAKNLWDLMALVDREHRPSPEAVQVRRNETLKATEPSWVLGARDSDAVGPSLLGADAVWSRLQGAASSQDECARPPCGKVSTTIPQMLRADCLCIP